MDKNHLINGKEGKGKEKKRKGLFFYHEHFYKMYLA